MRHKTRFPAQSLIEFAFILPLVLLLTVGFFDLGRAVFYSSSLSNAVRQGTRRGIVMDFDQSELEKIVLDNTFGLRNASPPVIITIEPTDGILTITAEYCFVPITSSLTQVFGSSCGPKFPGSVGFLLSAESAMQIEP